MADDLGGDPAGRFDRNAFGERIAAHRQMLALDDVVHRRIELGLHADDAQVRLDRFGRNRDAGDQPAAADRHHQRVEFRHGLKHFERDGALACDDQGIVIGMDHGQVVRLAVRAGEFGRLLQRGSGNHDLGAVTPGVLDFHHRRPHRHHDGGGNAEQAGVIGHALGVIAGRHRDHAASPLVRRQRGQAIERAALLEGRGELQVLEFEPELAAADLAERPALVAFGDENRAADHLRCGPDIVERNGKRGLLIRRCVLGSIRHRVASLRGHPIGLFRSLRPL